MKRNASRKSTKPETPEALCVRQQNMGGVLEGWSNLI
jgi:hypothetical protein